MQHDGRMSERMAMDRREFLAATGGALLWAGLPLGRATGASPQVRERTLVRVGYVQDGRCMDAARLSASDAGLLLTGAALAFRGPYPGLDHPLWRDARWFTVGVEYPHVPGVSVVAFNYQNGPAVNLSRVHRLVVPVVVDRPLTLVVERQVEDRTERQCIALGSLRCGTYVLALLPATAGWRQYPEWDAVRRVFAEPPPDGLLLHVDYARTPPAKEDQPA